MLILILQALLKMLKLNRRSEIFLKLFLLTFPFQVQVLLYKADFFSGQFNLFSSFFVFLSELFLLLALSSFALQRFYSPNKQQKLSDSFTKLEVGMAVTMMALLIWSISSVFFANDKVLALLLGLRVGELLGLVYLLLNKILSREQLLKYLFYGAFFQVIVGLCQYFKQGDLGLGFLGESRLSVDTLNVAKVNLGGEKILRAYGTFTHANIFGGYLMFCLGLLIQSLNRENFWKNLHFLLAFLIGILLSFSRSSWLALFAFGIVLLAVQAVKVNWKSLLIGGCVILFTVVLFGLDQVILSRISDFSLGALDQRLIFSEIARDMISDNFLFGVGGGNFVMSMSEYYSGVLSPWLFQPVHNFFMMAWAELGLLGVFLWLGICGIMIKQVNYSMRRIIKSERFYWKVYWALLFSMLILSMLDHYFYTTWSGQVVVFLMIGVIWMDYRCRREELAK